jgi:hypothetical protein
MSHVHSSPVVIEAECSRARKDSANVDAYLVTAIGQIRRVLAKIFSRGNFALVDAEKRRQVAALQSASREILKFHSWFVNPVRAISVIRGQIFGYGFAAL